MIQLNLLAPYGISSVNLGRFTRRFNEAIVKFSVNSVKTTPNPNQRQEWNQACMWAHAMSSLHLTLTVYMTGKCTPMQCLRQELKSSPPETSKSSLKRRCNSLVVQMQFLFFPPFPIHWIQLTSGKFHRPMQVKGHLTHWMSKCPAGHLVLVYTQRERKRKRKKNFFPSLFLTNRTHKALQTEWQ